MMLFERETPKTPFGNAPNPERASVHIKGRPGALEVLLDEEASLTTILRDMHALLSQNRAMLDGVSVRLNFGDRPLDRLQFSEIKRILDAFGLRLQRLDLTSIALEEFLEDEFGIPVQIKSAQPPAPSIQKMDEPALPPMNMPSHKTPPPATLHEEAPRYAAPETPPRSMHPNIRHYDTPTPQEKTPTPQSRYPTDAYPTQVRQNTDAYAVQDRSYTDAYNNQNRQQMDVYANSNQQQRPPARTTPTTARLYSPPQIPQPQAEAPQPPRTQEVAAPQRVTRRISLSERLAAKQPAYDQTPTQVHAWRETVPYEEDRDLDDLPDTLMNFAPSAAPDTMPEPHNPLGQVDIESSPPTGRQVHKIMRTCRAGTRLDLDGDVWVFGDVNPGAEIRATGDIMIFGSLRGIAHAGSDGNPKAVIAAFELNPMQLRLGDQIAVAPPSENRTKQRIETEVAFLNQHNQIEVKNVQGKFPHELQKVLS